MKKYNCDELVLMKDKNKIILSYTDFNGNLKDRSVYP